MRNISSSINMLEHIMNMSNEKPYLLRTRLERELVNIIDISKEYDNLSLGTDVKNILDKLKYISDLSTQSTSGVSNLFYAINDDIFTLLIRLRQIESN